MRPRFLMSCCRLLCEWALLCHRKFAPIPDGQLCLRPDWKGWTCYKKFRWSCSMFCLIFIWAMRCQDEFTLTPSSLFVYFAGFYMLVLSWKGSMFGTDDLGIVCGSCIHLWKLVLLFSTCPSMKLGFALGDIWNGFVSPLSPCECNLAAVLHFGSIKTWLRCLVAVHKYTMHLPGRRRGHYGNAELPPHWEQNLGF